MRARGSQSQVLTGALGLRSAVRLKVQRMLRTPPPLAGYMENRHEIPLVDPLGRGACWNRYGVWEILRRQGCSSKSRLCRP